MKKQLLSVLLAAGSLAANAQTVVPDSVEIGAGYANQVWYSMENGKQGTAAKDNWDIAFDLVGVQSGIQVNTAAGAMLWAYPKGNKSSWSTVDTAGLSTWTARYNSDTSWALGAIGRYADPNDPFDLDWGRYDLTNHTVVGDSIFIIKLVNGDYKKLLIEKLQSGTFTFKFANVDGSNETTATVAKSNFTKRNFAYYSLSGNQSLNREPDQTEWDIIFTQYTGFVPTPYAVTGVLHNRDTRTVRVDNIPNVPAYTNWQAHNDNSEINTIGYNWKSFNGSGYSIKDSLVFFIKSYDTELGDYSVWKLWFTDFSSSTGKYVFNKQRLKTASITGVNKKTVATMVLYPNPSNGSNVKLVYDIEKTAKSVAVQVYDVTGKLLVNKTLNSNAGMYTEQLSTNTLQKGMYIVTLSVDGQRTSQRLTVN